MVETNCGIAHILGIPLMNVYYTKVKLHERIRNDDFWRNTSLLYCCDIVSNSYNIVSNIATLYCVKNRRCESSRAT